MKLDTVWVLVQFGALKGFWLVLELAIQDLVVSMLDVNIEL